MKKKAIFKKIRTIEKERGGKCLSKEYLNSSTPLIWQCHKKHRWSAPLGRIIHLNTWCPKCAIEKRSLNSRLKLEHLKEIAASRGGKCNAIVYKNVAEKIEWECEVGHKWKAKSASVVGSKNNLGSWCPYCNSRGRHEELCRVLFSHIFKVDFPKVRPEWLRGNHGSSLELDGYSEKLKIAFEYHGPHHFKNIPYYYELNGRLASRLEKQKQRDQLKRRLCKNNGVTLIEIPNVKVKSSISDFGRAILKFCKEAGIKTARSIDFDNIDTRSLWTSKALKRINLGKDIASERGGELLSDTYISSQVPLKWKCSEGHVWSATLGSVQKGGWCRKCYDINRLASIKDIQNLARSRGGFCLSKEYLKPDEKLNWQCNQKHTWKATLSKVKGGQWCPICAQAKRGASQRANINDIKKVAEALGGKCKSKTYTNAITPLVWECDKGHLWKATAHKIRQGSWCPICLGKNKTIADAQDLAETRGGKCLSKVYKNNHTNLRWQCHLGHKWNAAYSNIQAGKWCPLCANENRGATQRATIEEMQNLAKNRGGKCLSTKYINANTHLKWICDKGHIWNATPGHVKHGTWCPKCAGK